MFRDGDCFENQEKLLLNLCISEGVFSFFLDNFRIVDFIRGLTFICKLIIQVYMEYVKI